MEHTVIYKRPAGKGTEDMIPVDVFQSVNKKSFIALNLTERDFEIESRKFGLGYMLERHYVQETYGVVTARLNTPTVEG